MVARSPRRTREGNASVLVGSEPSEPWKTRPMAGSDSALLSSIVAQVEELGRRVSDLADQYGSTPDSAIASELYSAERALVGARRALDRAARLMDA